MGAKQSIPDEYRSERIMYVTDQVLGISMKVILVFNEHWLLMETRISFSLDFDRRYSTSDKIVVSHVGDDSRTIRNITDRYRRIARLISLRRTGNLGLDDLEVALLVSTHIKFLEKCSLPVPQSLLEHSSIKSAMQNVKLA